jgi:hypothetical protein
VESLIFEIIENPEHPQFKKLLPVVKEEPAEYFAKL